MIKLHIKAIENLISEFNAGLVSEEDFYRALQNTAKMGLDDVRQHKIWDMKGELKPGDMVTIDHKKVYGMMNIGWRPTIREENKQRKIEVHFFDFESDIYEAYLALCIHQRIRSEQKFENLSALKDQLITDEKLVRGYFKIA